MSLPSAKKRKIFDGRYEVISIVGRGSDSVVYHARHLSGPQQEVALKVLLNKEGKSSTSERLRKEALTLVSCRHKYVVRLDDFHSVSDLCYLSMEYAPFGDLRKYITATKKPLSPDFGSQALQQAIEGLDFIHATGVLHRDLKPDNILVLNEREIRLADFGLALLPGDELDLEELQKGVGSLAYLPPEMLEAKGYDTRSDIYSLGVCFYEAMAGFHPFEQAPMSEQLNARLDSNIKPLNEINPAIPPHISAVVAKMMSYSPENRFQSAMEALRAVTNRSFTLASQTSAAELPVEDDLFDDPFEKEVEYRPSPYTAVNDDRPVDDSLSDDFDLLDEDDPFDFEEPTKKSIPTTETPRRETPTEEFPLERIQKMVQQESQQQHTVADRNAKIESEVSQHPETDELPEIPPHHLLKGTKSPRRANPIMAFIFTLPPKARPIAVGLMAAMVTIGLISLLSVTPKQLLSSTESHDASSEALEEDGASEGTDTTQFPHLIEGRYAGSIQGILPGVTSPLALISRPEQNSLTVVIGIEGWTPVSVSTVPEEGTPTRTIVMRSNGVLLNITGDSSSEIITGTFSNAITGESGAWSVKKIS
jgi:serine/threonine protein kinase